jgi:hypothetical protein
MMFRNSTTAALLLLVGLACLLARPGIATAQESPAHVNQNAPESVTGTLEGNQTDLLSAWRLLSGLAVRLLSGNEAELELLSGNAPQLLSGNEPELLSGNSASLLSGNDPHLLAGNTLLSNNIVEIHINESGNAPTLGSLAKSLTGLPSQRVKAIRRADAERAKLQDAVQAKLKAMEAKANAVAAQGKAQADAMQAEHAKMQRRIAELMEHNAQLRATIEELKAGKNASPDQ